MRVQKSAATFRGEHCRSIVEWQGSDSRFLGRGTVPVTEDDSRAWGYWTELKLKILSDYLPAFTRASQRLTDKIYLDLFAGRPENIGKLTRKPIDGSARRALDAKPAFTQVSLFELGDNAKLLRADVEARHPGRRGVRVYEGDCNDTITKALEELRPWNWAPTFALLDPDFLGIKWSTLKQLAEFKRADKWKTELLILIGHGYLPRTLEVRQENMNAKVADRLGDLIGCDDHLPIIRGLRDGKLNANQFGDEIVNLLRVRLEVELGYKTTHALTFRNVSGRVLYDMVFATDHWAGDEIIRAVYRNVSVEQEHRRAAESTLRRVLRKQAKETPAGQDMLFGAEEVPYAPPLRITEYQHTPIRRPFGFTRPFPERP